MQRRLALLLVGLVSLAGCPDDPYKASTWIKKLGGREHERAVQSLEELGDPSAITPLGEVWRDQGKQPRELEVIIGLARPLTPQEAKEKFRTDFEATGRPASWGAALPFLQLAVKEIDENNPRSVEGAMKASEAIGESRMGEGFEALTSMADRPATKNIIAAQIAAIRAMGKLDPVKDQAAGALIKIIDREPPQHPRTAKDREQGKQLEEKYKYYLATTGAAINALGELRIKSATKTLMMAMYRTPELFDQIRRALVATGPTAYAALKDVLEDKHSEIADAVTQLYRDKKLDKYCGDKGDAPPDQCQPVSLKDYYAAIVIGDFYNFDGSYGSVPALLAVLRKPAIPAYYVDEEAGPTQYNAVFDALRKIGAPSAKDTVLAIWKGGTKGVPAKVGKGGKAEPAAPVSGDSALMTRILAISAYPFVTRDTAGLSELGAIAADNGANDDLRRMAAEAFARLSRSAGDIQILEGLANKYFDASAKKVTEAAKAKPAADKADAEYAKQKTAVEELKKKALLLARDKNTPIADVKAANEAGKKGDDDLKLAKKKHRDAIAPYKQLDNMSKGYKGIARMFQMHIARIEVAIRCKDDLKCYSQTLSMTPDDSAKNLAKYIKDLKDWTKDEKLGLLEGNVERAMLEIGKAGAKAESYTDLLLSNAKSDNRIIRQSILLALPKIAKVPCADCEGKLDAAIKAGEGKTTVAGLQLETQMLRNYFAYAGGRTPNNPSNPPSPAAPAAPAEKPPAEAPAEDDK